MKKCYVILGRCLLSQCTTFLPHDPTAKLSALISRPSVRHVVVLLQQQTMQRPNGHANTTF